MEAGNKASDIEQSRKLFGNLKERKGSIGTNRIAAET
jgi:hypothetical protein